MLEEKIMADYKEAMKARDQLRVQTLSFLRSELKYCAIDKKAEKLADEEVIAVLRKLIKQRQDSIAGFKNGNRLDLAAKEEAEAGILKTYLPQELSEAAVLEIVEESAAATGACGIKDMGRLMKEVVSKARGRADNKLISDLVKKRLSGL